MDADGQELVGRIVKTPTRQGRIVVASRLLDLALIEDLGPDGQPTGGKSVLKTLKNIREAAAQ